MLIKCIKCNNLATWEYIPNGYYYYCDSCVPRGCSCMDYSSEPCCEFDNNKFGFEEEENE